ncbi:Raf kinase inhibitor-like protein, YbhB/YbcL family [Devosia sp. YR412]|uniref:YbhB/YbcL family Raf kinase inhibitor-like protein n=1 Tax=Devosia sp. YR412 TaxID=1881030 RepID=UPI0008AED665|nr:YbhB/YbcL family Raf kinase inhibitor-like protein [Devosia sp. YR412]SEP80944.1 Raf kinase inhibitor-like protein, YbhB/YbcL family [Devosia sp. YR412]
MIRPLLTLAVSSATLLVAIPAFAQPQGTIGEYSDVTVQGSILEPEPVTISDDAELAAQIKVPEGFMVEVVGRDLGNTRMLATHGEHVYATRRTEADVIRLNDADGDGKYDADGDGKYEDFTIVAARPGMHGLAFHGDTAYLATVNEVYTAPVNEDGSFGELTRIIDDLPDGGQHANRTLAIGPDEMLYITIGSTCNECIETNPESATILRASLDGKSRTIFASGLRNTIGFGWEPESGMLFGADHGTDWLGDEAQQEEFNQIEQGAKYGWPYVFDFGNLNPHMNPPEGIALEQWAAQSKEPAVGYTAHAAPMQMTFYTGTAFPEEYRGDAFIAMRGSWNRRPPSGYEISRVDFVDGKPGTWDHFAEGFLVEGEDTNYGFLARLAGITQTEDGALLLADDFNGIVYRISHEAGDSADAATVAETPDVTMKPRPSDIAINLVEAEGTVEVSSPSFTTGETIPLKHAAEGDNASPALEWGTPPEGTLSFLVIADDPDAAEPKPFVHWVLYDIPGDATGISEGLSTDAVLQQPEGAKQGSNSKGQTGYMGPRPPLGDPAHHYHFQVFALDLAQLPVDPGATRDEVLAAIEGHVIAKGELVGTYQRPGAEKPIN